MYKLKRLNVIITALLLVAMMLSFVACNKTKTSEESGADKVIEKVGDSNAPAKTADGDNKEKIRTSLPDKLKNPDTTILSAVSLESVQEAINQYQTKYGGKVNYIEIAGGERQEKLASMIMAGDPPDGVQYTETNQPTFMINELLQPIEDYYDLNDPVWHLDVMTQAKYKGRHYGVTAGPAVFLIFYNKTLFENNGLKTPVEYEKEGNWNWETLKEVAMKLTQDTDRDGTIDQWGFAFSGARDVFISANGADIVKANDDGTFELALNDPKVIQALQFMQEGFNEYKYMNAAGGKYLDVFLNGNAAMIAERQWTLKNKTADVKFEWDVVSFPAGPEGKKDVSPAGSGYWGMATGARNPEGAAAFIYIRHVLDGQIGEAALNEIYTPEQLARVKKYLSKTHIAKYKGIGKLGNLANANIFNPIQKGEPVLSTLEKAAPLFQNEIDLIMKK